MQEIILKIRYFERELSKSLKKVNFLFFSNPVHFNHQNYKKQKGPGSSDQSLFTLHNKFKKIPLLAMFYLSKFYQQIYASQFIIHDINYSTSICPFKSGKCGKEGKIYKNLNILSKKELCR